MPAEALSAPPAGIGRPQIKIMKTGLLRVAARAFRPESTIMRQTRDTGSDGEMEKAKDIVDIGPPQTELTLPFFMDLAARRCPDREFIVCENIRRTFKEENDRANSLANALMDLGVKKGDTVASYQGNGPEIFDAYMACVKAGAIPVPINTRLTAREIAWIVNHAEAKVFIFSGNLSKMIEDIRPELKFTRHLVCVGETSISGAINIEDLISKYPSGTPPVRLTQNDNSMLMYTSGTTGFPKGALCRHFDSIMGPLNAIMYFASAGIAPYAETALFPLPFFHMAAFTSAMRQVMRFGRCIIMRKFDPVRMLQIIQEEKVNSFVMVPTVVNEILNVPNIEKYDLSSLNMVQCTGAPLPDAVQQRFNRTFPNVPLVNVFGLTENPTVGMKVDGQVGYTICPFTEVSIMDEEGDEFLPQGEIGEICIRGPALFSGYYKDKAASDLAFAKGWFHTGDVGLIDEKGLLHIKDRKHDMIICGGENVYPAEVEKVLYSHPKIFEAAVIGIQDEKFGEAVMAVVALRPGNTMTEQEVIDHALTHLGKFKVPKKVEFVASLPKSSVGKILRRELRVQYKNMKV
jgi:acyl-CoA synthetase (AMP-forming)/AMP-acid ligase II